MIQRLDDMPSVKKQTHLDIFESFILLGLASGCLKRIGDYFTDLQTCT